VVRPRGTSGPVQQLTTAGSAEGTRATHVDATTNTRTSAAAHNGNTTNTDHHTKKLTKAGTLTANAFSRPSRPLRSL